MEERETDSNTGPEELLSHVAYVLLCDNSALSGPDRFACWSHWEPRFLQSVEDSERDKRFTSAFQMSTESTAKANACSFHKSECRTVSSELTIKTKREGKSDSRPLCLFHSKCWYYAHANHRLMKRYSHIASTQLCEELGEVHFRIGRKELFWVVASAIRQDSVGGKENCERR